MLSQMYPHESTNALARYFTGLAEFAFETRLGICDPPLIEYVADLLIRFVSNDAIFGVPTPAGSRLTEVAEMLVQADEFTGAAKRTIHRHIGDFTLFWTGVYPEALRHRQAVSPRDRFIDYREQGKRAYHIAATLRQADTDSEAEVLERLSVEFESCAVGLGEIRKEWERRDGADNGGILIP